MDHAGIATRLRLEERLRGEGISRYDLGRENSSTRSGMERRIYDHQGTQARCLSVDYSRAFHPDEGLSCRSQGLCGPWQERLDLPW